MESEASKLQASSRSLSDLNNRFSQPCRHVEVEIGGCAVMFKRFVLEQFAMSTWARCAHTGHIRAFVEGAVMPTSSWQLHR